MEIETIDLPGGSTMPVRLLAGEPKAPVVVIWPGMGVPGSYFDIFAAELVARGLNTAIGEIRGQGASRPRPSRASTYGYHELASVDYPEVVRVARERFPGSKPFVLGHSLGGQIGALYAARARNKLGGLILVASGAPYYANFQGRRPFVTLFGSQLMATAANVAGYWPGDRIGGFGRQSRVLVGDWSRLVRTGRYDPSGADMDYEDRIARLKVPVLSISIAGDALAPAASVRLLAGKFGSAEVTMWRQPEPLGHSGWIRSPSSTVDHIEPWVRERS